MKKQKIIGLLMMVPLMAFMLYTIVSYFIIDWKTSIKVFGSFFSLLIAIAGGFFVFESK